jgi:hypothetical protein
MSLPILNPISTPTPDWISSYMQYGVDVTNASLASDLTLAQDYLSVNEYAAATESRGIAAMQYGNALERMFGDWVDSSLVSDMIDPVGGPYNVDFTGVGSADGLNFDVTTDTVAQIEGHLGRDYGYGLDLITYSRRADFTLFPEPPDIEDVPSIGDLSLDPEQ